MSMRPSIFRGSAAICLGLVLAGCAYPKTPALKVWNLKEGYRFVLTGAEGGVQHPKNSEQLFVVLAFSGGGTRAAALSYGVLHELERVRFHWNEEAGTAEPCPETGEGCRSLLDEVDVISSVSGGSFTAAYYALHGRRIFTPADPFHTRFLYAPVQRDLFAHSVYRPRNWKHLGARVEIAAREHASRLFGTTTFAALEGTRPYVVLNATDMSTGARFEFTQDQFDVFCGDLSAFPVARAVAASSAFPGLLNSMTLDTHTGTCDYKGPGTGALDASYDWVADGQTKRTENYRRFRAGREVLELLDDTRTHLHLLDGGLADNVGLRSVLRALGSSDAPMIPTADPDEPFVSGWSLLRRINRQEVRHIVVIGVNAKTNKSHRWDRRPRGPGTFSVLNASTGIPMSSFTAESLSLLQEYGDEAALNMEGQPKFHAFDVAFENIPDDSRSGAATDAERQFFLNMPTTFALSRHEVDCLTERGASLLRDALSIEGEGLTFGRLVSDELKGRTEGTPLPRPAGCNTGDGPALVGVRPHYLDLGVQWTVARSRSRDVANEEGLGFTARFTRPNGFGVLAGYGGERFPTRLPIAGRRVEAGDLQFKVLSAGIALTRHMGRIEASASLSGGYGFGDFEASPEGRDAYGRRGYFGLRTDATNTWVARPALSLWLNLTNRFALTGSLGYSAARSTVRITSADGLSEQHRVRAAAARLSFGIGASPF